MTRRHTTLLAAATLSLALSGCISFGAKPPPSLLTLQATSAPQPGQQQTSATQRSVVVQVPSAPQSLASARVPVQETPTAIGYIPKALWAEPPARLFARLLSDTVTTRANMVVLSTVQSVTDPSSTLAGELRSFGVDAATRSALVVYDAALTGPGGGSVAKRRFEARVPVETIDATHAGVAINAAANQVAVEVADWLNAQPAPAPLPAQAPPRR